MKVVNQHSSISEIWCMVKTCNSYNLVSFKNCKILDLACPFFVCYIVQLVFGEEMMMIIIWVTQQ
jgi:hypothetical protein